MSLSRFIQDNFLKRRLLFSAEHAPFIKKKSSGTLQFSINVQTSGYVTDTPQIKKLLPPSIPSETADVELNAVVCTNRVGGEFLGIGFLLSPNQNRVWYDNVPIDPGDGRSVGDFVLPEARGLGIGKAINAIRIQHAIGELRLERVTAVVESYRTAAIRAQAVYSEAVASNWLLKLAGYNIVSACESGPYKGVWYVGPGMKRKWRIETQ